MSEKVWSCSAIRIVGKEKCLGTLILNKHEFIFQHDLSSDFIPINILTAFTNERLFRVPGCFTKRKVLIISNSCENESPMFILKGSSSDEINKHIEIMREAFLSSENERAQLLIEEQVALDAARESARSRRKLIREQIKKKRAAQRVKEETTQSPTAEITGDSIAKGQTPLHLSKPNGRPAKEPSCSPNEAPAIYVSQDKAKVKGEANQAGNGLHDYYQQIANCLNAYVQTKASYHSSSLVQNGKRAVENAYAKHALILQIIHILDMRCEMLELEDALQMYFVSPQDVPKVARIIYDLNSRKQKQPKLFLYNILRHQFGNVVGTQYYHEVVHFLNA